MAKNAIPGDSFGNPINGIAKRVLTRTVAPGTRVEVVVPEGAFEVSILGAATYFESSATYVEEGVTYGTGYAGTLMTFPVYNKKSFWLTNAGTVTVMFSSIKE